MTTFTLPRGIQSAQLAMFAATAADYERLRDEHDADDRVRFHSHTGKPWTVCSWEEDGVSVNLHAPDSYQPRPTSADL